MSDDEATRLEIKDLLTQDPELFIDLQKDDEEEEPFAQLTPNKDGDEQTIEEVIEEVKHKQTLNRTIIHKFCLEQNFKMLEHTINNIDKL